MKKVNLALCFLDDNEKIVAKKDLNVSWDLDGEGTTSGVERVLVFDEVASMLNYQIEPTLYSCIRELLDMTKGNDK